MRPPHDLSTRNYAKLMLLIIRNGGRPRRGRGGASGSGGGGRKRNERPAKSAADLDAEMEVGNSCYSRIAAESDMLVGLQC